MSDAETITFGGEEFRIADKVGLMPLMRFAHVASGGVDAEDMAGLVAIHDLLEQCFPEDEWSRFQRVATKTRADGAELMGVIKSVFEAIGRRPTGRSSDSSDGPTPTPLRSVDGSSSEVIARLQSKGRPDLAYMVDMVRAGSAV